MRSREPEKGQALLGAIAVITVLGILIPGLIYLSQREAVWTAKQTQTTTAFQAAEAGVDRAVWKLNDTPGTWQAVASSGVAAAPSGYDGNTVFFDISGGMYKVKIASGPASNQITVAAVGVDTSTAEVRGVKAIYNLVSIDSSLYAKTSISLSGAGTIHWGKISSPGSIALSGTQTGKYYPRKFCKGLISPRDSDGAGGQKTDGLEWWDEYDIPSAPTLDFDALRSSAQATSTYSDASGSVSINGMSGYSTNRTMDYVWFFEDTSDGNASVTWSSTSYMRGKIIVLGDLSISGNGNGSVTVRVPGNASAEYQHSNAASAWVWTDGGTASLTGLKLYGFIYAKTSSGGVGGGNVYGAIWIDGAYTGAGNFDLYYNAGVDDGLFFSNLSGERVSWQEFLPESWASPSWPS